MEVLRELEKMISSLVEKYNSVKLEKADLQKQYDELFEEFEKISEEKENLNHELSEMREKQREVETSLTQIKSDLINKIGEEFENKSETNEYSQNADIHN
ncbi:hypothetical protein OF820_04500 [Oceanotoga sp. DSM 15011]|jgi:chromosome segregation ATPase|uniref:hypothetical protein n=1 Tax=Oceanotoga TaxID=1255275 RepID=UPI0021F4EEED|nr:MULTISPECIES: hypothetical protein [Oceanotoga]MDN5342350.1 hypothetical protein [Oceanotoga sp.]MDO7976111.1 hypothetical protein [Oceanotoga teriensis]UYP00947.1 hypothetical protein OF820_04500 [Oceanotoga sp. DSM 15011]